jgi:hypothetical protein
MEVNNTKPPVAAPAPGNGNSDNTNTDLGMLQAAGNQAKGIQSALLTHNMEIAPIMAAKTVSEDGKK